MSMEAASPLKDLCPPHATQTHMLLHRSAPLQFQVENVRRGCPGARYADRFSLLVPCCLDHVRWDVIFSIDHPWHAPDIIFPAEDEMFQVAMLAEDNSSDAQAAWNIIKTWNVKDSTKLLKLVVELRSFYLKYQRKLVQQVDDPIVRFEYGTLSNLSDLEVCLVKRFDKPNEVKFALPVLQVDFELVGVRHVLTLHLQVIFSVKKVQWSSSIPQLKLFAIPSLKDVFDIEDVKLPTWPDGMCISEYVPTLRDTLKKQVQDALISQELRQNFIETLFLPFGRPLEADTVYGRKVSVLACTGTFVFLVHFSLSIQFPKQQPDLLLQSCLHFDTVGKPITRLYVDYPWSPRWDASEMVQRIYDFVVEESSNFKKYCSDILQQHR